MQDRTFEREWTHNGMLVSLRLAEAEDKEFCRRTHHQAYRDVIMRQFGPWDEARQDTFFEGEWNTADIDLIVVNQEPAGCLCLQLMPDHLWIAEIQILPAFQGRGLGTQILNRLMRYSEGHSIPVRLQVLHANERAFALYQRLGFQVTGHSDTHNSMERKVASGNC